MLALVIFVLTACAYVVGRSRATALRKKVESLHSLPRYYGYYAAICTLVPGVLLLVLWSVIEPGYLKSSTINTLPAEVQALSDGELDLVLNDIKNLATGGISQSENCLLYTSPSPRDRG